VFAIIFRSHQNNLQPLSHFNPLIHWTPVRTKVGGPARPVVVGARYPFDDTVQAQTAEVIGHLPRGHFKASALQ
jgi:hypothetical protein